MGEAHLVKGGKAGIARRGIHFASESLRHFFAYDTSLLLWRLREPTVIGDLSYFKISAESVYFFIVLILKSAFFQKLHKAF